MSDPTTSGEPSAPETAAGAAPTAAPASTAAPLGAFGNARGSGLSRGKRATPSAAAPAASSTSVSSYKPTSVEVITPQREYTNPFASEQPASLPANEPAPSATPVADAPQAALVQNTNIPVANAPVTGASEPPAFTAPAAGEPITPPTAAIQPSVEKAEIKILPPADVKRPAVSWGEGTNTEETRPQRDERPTFRPERREGSNGAGNRERDPRAFQPRDTGKPQDTRFPRRDTALEQRSPLPREARETRENRESRRPQPAPEPVKKSGGFLGWLKGLFGGAPEQPATSGGAQNRDHRDGQPRDGDGRGGRRRNRGGRGRGGYQGENRGPRDGQPRDPRDHQPRGEGFQGGDQPQGERRFEGGEGGGGRRRRRGGRGRYRDDRGGPAPEGQQGGGAI
jgi:translation initiation factor IF-2